ncbi:PqqD family peptide modification chaperone [Nostocoides sp. F2B08]|uniref:PqqD family protein n=1 Tax=Nostocoides sp. F2B08 TaxID=2653936 RepID=UPI001262E788|nr:PqqD family protein [Tetrasphaera sp. F2B08]KAB7743346.1 PqqD family peptide modification chaperone [Tetrasphaera sp. F2B08]
MTAARLERHPAIETAWVVDRYLLFDERDGVVHELNPSASAVWDLIDGARAEKDVIESLSAQFGQDLRADVQVALSDFRTRGLLSDDPVDRA